MTAALPGGSWIDAMPTARRTVCNLCERPGALESSPEVVEINCNVRRFVDRRFTVWRCENCRSIHSRDVIDLAPYYVQYPFQQQKLDIGWRIISRNYLRRLERAGLRRHHSLLDYGCGSGLLVEWLRRKGYHRAEGFDAYTSRLSDRSVLARTYDFIVLQDVIEHVEEPTALLDEVVSLTAPGGMICIGTPNAEALDLDNADRYVHSLHQPYHVHVLSASVLRSLAEARGLMVERFHDVFYADTFVPFANVRFFLHYARLFDNTLDLSFDPYRFSWRLLTPKSLALALMGRFWPLRTEMTFLLRKPP